MQTRRRSSRRPLRAAVAASVATVALVTAAPTAEAARPTTESPVVAESAGRALDALERWEESNRPAHYVRYVRAREHTAELLAREVGISAAGLVADWEAADDRHQVAVLSALTQLGVPYRTNARKPDVAFDCSGLTSWAWAEAGIEIPRSSRFQIRATDEIDEVDDLDVEAQAGYLVYYPGHISMYLGQGFMIHAPATGSRVEVVPVSSRTRTVGDPVTAEVLEQLEALTPPDAIF